MFLSCLRYNLPLILQCLECLCKTELNHVDSNKVFYSEDYQHFFFCFSHFSLQMTGNTWLWCQIEYSYGCFLLHVLQVSTNFYQIWFTFKVLKIGRESLSKDSLIKTHITNLQQTAQCKLMQMLMANRGPVIVDCRLGIGDC